jgi:hypothetical protein
MIITISRPSNMEAKIMFDAANSDDSKVSPDVMAVQPRRYSKNQRKINVFPFCVRREGTVGAFDKNTNPISDQGYITLDTRTGKLVIEHRNEEVPVELDGGKK